jgi:OFA family oxalate/formate antiporter-like MFS transporter
LDSAFLALALLNTAAAVAATWLLRGLLSTHPNGASGETASRSGYFKAPLVVLWGCFFFGSAVGVVVLSHAAPLTVSLGGSAREAAWAVTLVTIGNGIGRLAGGPLCARFPSRLVLVGAPLCNALALGLLLAWPSVSTALLAMFAVGVGYGSLASALPISIVKAYGAAQLSPVYGRIFTAWGAAGLLGPFLGGFLFDMSGSYATTLTASVAACLLGAGLGFSYRGERQPQAN